MFYKEYTIKELERTDWTTLSLEELRFIEKSLDDRYYYDHGDIKQRVGNLHTEVKLELMSRWNKGDAKT